MIYLGSDHRGFVCKEFIKQILTERGVQFEDFGPYSDELTDYLISAVKVARAAANGGKGILMCGTGIGMSMAANKVHGVRAARCTSAEDARACRDHNDANVLCIPGQPFDKETTKNMIEAFLDTPFSTIDRYARRKEQLHEQLETK